ncbi:hypothetical protein BH11MYX3_BH11MYX3_38660 [soil metagenome]
MLLSILTLVSSTVEDAAAAYWSHPLPMHPKLVHVPMALCILMPMIAIMIWLGVRRGWFTPRVWLIAAVLQGATLCGGLAALKTGGDDGALVEGYASEEALATHEARAHWFLYVAGANLVLCGVTVLQRERIRQQLLGAIAIVGLFAGSYAGYRVGDAGGRLVYVGNASDAHR